jgi:hypothetical protein
VQYGRTESPDEDQGDSIFSCFKAKKSKLKLLNYLCHTLHYYKQRDTLTRHRYSIWSLTMWGKILKRLKIFEPEACATKAALLVNRIKLTPEAGERSIIMQGLDYHTKDDIVHIAAKRRSDEAINDVNIMLMQHDTVSLCIKSQEHYERVVTEESLAKRKKHLKEAIDLVYKLMERKRARVGHFAFWLVRGLMSLEPLPGFDAEDMENIAPAGTPLIDCGALRSALLAKHQALSRKYHECASLTRNTYAHMLIIDGKPRTIIGTDFDLTTAEVWRQLCDGPLKGKAMPAPDFALLLTLMSGLFHNEGAFISPAECLLPDSDKQRAAIRCDERHNNKNNKGCNIQDYVAHRIGVSSKNLSKNLVNYSFVVLSQLLCNPRVTIEDAAAALAGLHRPPTQGDMPVVTLDEAAAVLDMLPDMVKSALEQCRTYPMFNNGATRTRPTSFLDDLRIFKTAARDCAARCPTF